MSILTNEIPIPADYENPIVYSNDNEVYMYLDVRATGFDSVKESESGWLYWYNSATGETGEKVEYNGTSILCYNSTSDKWYSVNDSISQLTADSVVFSVYDVYNVNSQRVLIGSSADSFSGVAVGHSVTSDTMFSGVFSPVLALVPAVILAVLGFIGVRKGFAFIKSKIGGA